MAGLLGIITAGALWTPLSDESQFDENVRQLHGQVQKVIGATRQVEEGSDESIATADEAKEELERLRENLTATTDSGSPAVLADPSQPATIPAGVPKLPSIFQTVEQIQEITRLVLSSAVSDMEMSRVGFWGMGGIGKTVTGAAIVRNEDVRLHFDIIVWLPLGQTPMISKLQNLCHMQCTGKELSPELSSDEKKETLQQVMAGKRVLLCLDDLWEEEHELELNFADVHAGSKVLISTRMKALLSGGHQVEVGLPSPSDSARMLLSAAGVEVDSSDPKGVSEIVDLCGRLPLALGIAGRLAASLGLVGTEDWSDMIGVLKEELRESHSGGTEEGMIRASLRGLKGSAEEQANVRCVLLMFAFMPEDTHCPLDVMLLMFNAVYEGSGATLMHIRKWLKILINRSLVLGTIDRPSVHDLVLDFAEAQHNAAELCDSHCRIVEAFRAARPVDAHGRRRYDAARVDQPLDSYVCAEGGHLVSLAMKDDESIALRWLYDLPQDAIVLFAAQGVGLEKLQLMATQAEQQRSFWLAAQSWSLVREIALRQGGLALALDPALKSLDAMAQASLVADTEARDDLRLLQAQTVTNAFNVPVLIERTSLFEEIFASGAAMREPTVVVSMGVLLGLTVPKTPDWAGDCALVGKHYFTFFKIAQDAAMAHPDPLERLKCSLLFFAMPFVEVLRLHRGDFDWDEFYGRDAQKLLAVMSQYDYRAHHDFINGTLNQGKYTHCCF